jgi:hypothetical protein
MSPLDIPLALESARAGAECHSSIRMFCIIERQRKEMNDRRCQLFDFFCQHPTGRFWSLD